MPDLPKQDQQELSRGEVITALVHYYRAEVQRSLAWRERLDLTTNWAVGAAAAFIGFTFSHPEIHHSLFFFGIGIVYALLFVEARRYRFFDAYEYRVRLLHQNFFYGILTGRFEVEPGSFWIAELASDLRYPQYKMDFIYALGRRFQANYLYLFGILLAGWLLKIKIHPSSADTLQDYMEHASMGVVPGWVTFLLLFLFVVHAIILVRIGRKPRGGRDILFSTPPKGDQNLPIE